VFHREAGTFKTSYAKDMALFPLPIAKGAAAFFLATVAVAIPAAVLTGLMHEYYLTIFTQIFIAIVGALGLNILVGWTGQISIGHAAFMSVGAYTVGNLVTKVPHEIFGGPMPFWLTIPAGGLMAALIGTVVGIPSLRIKGTYLAIATLASQLIIEWIINHTPAISGGAGASIQVPRPTLFGNELKTPMEIYYFTLFFAVVAIVATMNLVRSRIGRAFVAIRDQDIAAEIIGINIFRYKLLSFAISSFYAGVCGVLFAYYSSIANYEAFQINISIDYLAMIIIGGLGSVLGTILGVIFVQLLPVAIREVVTAYGGYVIANPEQMQLDSLLRTLMIWGIPLLVLLAVRRFVSLGFWTRLIVTLLAIVPAAMTALGVLTYLFGSQFANTSALSAMAASLKLIIFGMLIIFFLVVEPEGLARLWRNVRNYFRVWPFSY